MVVVRNIIIIALAMLAQGTVIARFAIYGARPDLMLLVLIFLVTVSGPAEGIAYGFFIGLLQDVYSPDVLGANAFAMSLMAFMLGVVRDRVTVEYTGVQAMVVFIAVLVHDLVLFAFTTGFDSTTMTSLMLRESLPCAAYTAALLVVVIWLKNWIFGGGAEFVLQGLLGHRR